MNIYVANINRDATQDDLRTLFAEFGEVGAVKIINDKYTGTPRGFGFVEMPDDNEALEAIRKLNNATFFGRNLDVSKARPSTDRY